MASGMQDIKRRIKSVTSIEHVTNAMKLVSAAKLRRAKLNFEKTNEFSDFIINSIAEVFNNTEEVPEKYLLRDNEIENTCYIIVTSGRGFCGSFMTRTSSLWNSGGGRTSLRPLPTVGDARSWTRRAGSSEAPWPDAFLRTVRNKIGRAHV